LAYLAILSERRLDLEHQQLVKKAKEIRVREHRLKPSLRLRTKKEIYKFIHDEGLVSFLGGNELPSCISAVLGRSWKPSARGFTGWMDWWDVKISGLSIAQVSREMEGRNDILATRLFRRTKTFVSNKIWPTLDPIVKHHRDLLRKEMILSDTERRLLKTIEEENSIRTDRLRKMLGLEAKENNSKFHRALTNLESYSLIAGIEDPHPEKHLHANIWQTWDTRTRRATRNAALSYEKALADLLERTIHACIIAPENQIGKWFPWSKDMKAVTEDLLGQGRVIKAGSFLVRPLVIRH
jgi:hypothetical protein